MTEVIDSYLHLQILFGLSKLGQGHNACVIQQVMEWFPNQLSFDIGNETLYGRSVSQIQFVGDYFPFLYFREFLDSFPIFLFISGPYYHSSPQLQQFPRSLFADAVVAPCDDHIFAGEVLVQITPAPSEEPSQRIDGSHREPEPNALYDLLARKVPACQGKGKSVVVYSLCHLQYLYNIIYVFFCTILKSFHIFILKLDRSLKIASLSTCRYSSLS